MSRLTPEIAVNRFGMGARSGELSAAAADPIGWLEKQLGPVHFSDAPGSSRAAIELISKRHDSRRAGVAQAVAEQELRAIGGMGEAMAIDTLTRAITSDQPLAARLLDFFSNHFSVSVGPVPMRGLAASLEREAIGPMLGGRFVDMLLAVERHPAMLNYLNNAQSVGPGSRRGRRQERGLNENLAREILELHTLGVDGGYTQADVRELAKAITGWSVGVPRQGEEPAFRFREATHEPGTRVIMGRSYDSTGVEQGESVLRDLAAHPATAQHLCFKLARHLVADDPSPGLVSSLKERWLETGGSIPDVMRALLRHPDALSPARRKLKTPREFLISVMRAARLASTPGHSLLEVLADLGQKPLSAGSPAGFKDEANAWDGAEALMTRIDWVEQLGEQISEVEPLDVARNALGEWLQPETVTAIKGAASRRQAFTLLFMSPEFLRR